MTRVSVVGLGKLGVCMAAALAHKGFVVTGVDTNPKTIDMVNSCQPPVFEPGLQEMMLGARDRLHATADCRLAVERSEVTFIVVPTPSEEHGGFSLGHVKSARAEIGRALKSKAGNHLVVLTSTVLPGASQYGVIPVLEQEAGKRCGEDFGFCYGPEFIALGSVLRDFLNPDFILIGEADSDSGEQLASLYKKTCDNDPPVARMSTVNAELAKIAVNTYVTMKITFANMLAPICEQLPGGDIDTVTSALGLDTRIGPRYLKGALGYGGPCFPRDNRALAYLARELGQGSELAEVVDRSNHAVLDRLAQKILCLVFPGEVVAVLGLAYKPDTAVVEESQGLKLAERLASRARVVVYDPAAMGAARCALGDRVGYASSVRDCLQQADAVVIANPDRKIREAMLAELAMRPRPRIIDVWRLLRGRIEERGDEDYQAVGLGSDSETTISRLKALWSPAETMAAGVR